MLYFLHLKIKTGLTCFIFCCTKIHQISRYQKIKTGSNVLGLKFQGGRILCLFSEKKQQFVDVKHELFWAKKR